MCRSRISTKHALSYQTGGTVIGNAGHVRNMKVKSFAWLPEALISPLHAYWSIRFKQYISYWRQSTLFSDPVHIFLSTDLFYVLSMCSCYLHSYFLFISPVLCLSSIYSYFRYMPKACIWEVVFFPCFQIWWEVVWWIFYSLLRCTVL